MNRWYADGLRRFCWGWQYRAARRPGSRIEKPRTPDHERHQDQRRPLAAGAVGRRRTGGRGVRAERDATPATAHVAWHLTATRATGLHKTAVGCVLATHGSLYRPEPPEAAGSERVFVFGAGEATISASRSRVAARALSHMDLTFECIGTGDAFGSGGRFNTCFLVSSGETSLLIDCGATSPVALQQRSIAPPSLTHLLISHLHGDHFGGVPFLLLDAAYNRPRETRLRIAGPPGVERRVVDTLELLFPGTSGRVLPRVEPQFVELPARHRTEIDGVAVTPFAVVHPSGAPAYALRIEVGGRTITYSGDTEWTPSLIDAADGADLFICECFGWETDVPSHLSHRVLCEHASELRCKQMMLTHLGPEMLARVNESRWPCASDGLVLNL